MSVSTPASEYELNEWVRVKLNAKVDDVDTDPTNVRVYFRKPDGALVDFAAVDDTGDGNWKYEIKADQVGTWSYRFEGDGAAAGAGERSFIVKHSRTR